MSPTGRRGAPPPGPRPEPPPARPRPAGAAPAPATRGAAVAPVRVDAVELRDLANDIAQNFTAGFPGPKLTAALDQVTGADAVIAVTPIFTASYSGLFKSFFDVLDQEALTGKPVLIAATGGTARHSLALEHALRPLFAYLRAVVVPTAVYAASEDWGNTDGLNRRIDRAAAELAALLTGTAGRRAAPADDPLEEVVPFAEQLAALRVQE
ncbi:CE1759 family FMN reductase [Streptomyces albidoflavus]